MDGEEADIVIRARQAEQREQLRSIAWQVTEMRNLWGSGPRWTVAQTMGEAPPPDARNNDAGALSALEERASSARQEAEETASAGWDDSFAVDESLFGDVAEDEAES